QLAGRPNHPTVSAGGAGPALALAAMSDQPRVAVVGHVEWVTFTHAQAVPPPGEIVHLSDPLDQPGGGGAVSAMALARMGAQATFFTALASDVPARAVLEAPGVEVLAAPRGGHQTR